MYNMTTKYILPKEIKEIVPIGKLLATATHSKLGWADGLEEVHYIINKWSNDPNQEKISNIAIFHDQSWAFIEDESDDEEDKNA